MNDYNEPKDFKKLELAITVYFTLEMIGNFYQQPRPKYQYFTKIDTYIDM